MKLSGKDHIINTMIRKIIKHESVVTYVANLMQNCVKYLRDEYRLSRMIGKLVLRCPMMELTYGLWSPTDSTFCHDDYQQTAVRQQ